MLDTACYKKPFLKQVVARINFVAPIVALEKTLPAKLAKVASAHFPISEPRDAVAKQFHLTPAGMKESEKSFRQWVFWGLEREKQLILTPSSLDLVYTRYTTYQSMKSHFCAIVDGVAKEFPDAQAARFGLRFVNIIEEIKLSSPIDWGEYIAPELLQAEAFFAEPASLTRLMHMAELKYGEVDLRFQFGMPNPDYPAVIKRPQFVLDLDAYVQTAHELSSSPQYVEQAHNLIQGLFERSITEKLRKRMNAK
jgi:uncharacterized protein (TIGR04255 family)